MEIIKKNNWTLSIGFVACTVMIVSTSNAQSSLKGLGAPGTGADQNREISPTKSVDSKGNIKYLQSNNGITRIENTTGQFNTTTLQLGGELVDDTYLDVKGKTFALDRIDLISKIGAGAIPASIDAGDKAVHGTGTGFTFLVRDEATGGVKKILPSEIAVAAVSAEATLIADAASGGTYNLLLAGITTDTPIGGIAVFRNGIKLPSSSYAVNTNGSIDISIGIDGFQSGDFIEARFVK